MTRRDISKITPSALATWMKAHEWVIAYEFSHVDTYRLDGGFRTLSGCFDIVVPRSVGDFPDDERVHVLTLLAEAYDLDAWTDAYDAIIPRAVACLGCRELMTEGTQAVLMGDGWWCRTCAEDGDGWHETTGPVAEALDAARLWRTGTNEREVKP